VTHWCQLGHSFVHTRRHTLTQVLTSPPLDGKSKGLSIHVLMSAGFKVELLLQPFECPQ
jgi:hypothetical protein